MKTNETILAAWSNARSKRSITDNFIFHSDRGTQYTPNKMRMIFSTPKITQSMSKKGDCWDNTVAESFFKTIKYEWLNRFYFENTDELKITVNEYMIWYNTKRLHSALGYKTPLEKQIELEQKTIEMWRNFLYQIYLKVHINENRQHNEKQTTQGFSTKWKTFESPLYLLNYSNN